MAAAVEPVDETMTPVQRDAECRLDEAVQGCLDAGMSAGLIAEFVTDYLLSNA